MIIQFDTDKNIDGNEQFSALFEDQKKDKLSKHNHLISSVDVHLSDQDGNKNGLNSMHCIIEVSSKVHQPTTVSKQADILDRAVTGEIVNWQHLRLQSLACTATISPNNEILHIKNIKNNLT